MPHLPTFEWTTNYMTDLPSVDDQHRHLVDLINRLGQFMETNRVSPSELRDIFDELVSYAQFHFAEEERLMQSAGIDARHIEQHRQIHQRFAKDVTAFDSVGKDQALQFGSGLLDYLVHWLAYHILGQDQDMARQIAAVQAGMDPAQAFELHERQKDTAVEPLLAALNRLVQQLSARNRELVELNHSLEERVTQRTLELSQANAELKMLSLTDGLTGLSNRRHAMMQLDALWRESDANGKPLSALMIDADNFKEVNDTYGHDAGDEVLIALSRALSHALRSDDLVFRLGGDEFLVLCPATDFDGALKVADMLLKKVSTLRVATGTGFWKNSISVGVATREATMEHFEDLIKTADKSVYLAKNAGRNCARASQM